MRESDVEDLKMVIYEKKHIDRRRNNLPTASEVSVIVQDNQRDASSRDIVLQKVDRRLNRLFGTKLKMILSYQYCHTDILIMIILFQYFSVPNKRSQKCASKMFKQISNMPKNDISFSLRIKVR
jgi:hypothetical protein